MTRVHRIVSLLPASTEVVVALGLEDQLVGRSHECDYPKSVQDVPICSTSKLALDGTNYEIHQRLIALVQEGLSIYRLDADQLNDLQPTVLITQNQCSVCAVSLEDVEQATCELVGSKPAIVSLEPNSLLDVFSDIRSIASTCGVADKGESLVEAMKEQMAAIGSRSYASKPKVATLEWMNPLMSGGNWMPSLVEMAGGENIFGKEGEHSPWLNWRDLEDADPDCVLLLPCGFSLERTIAELDAWKSEYPVQRLRAWREKNIYCLDGNQYFNRPGPRLVDSVKILSEVLHSSSEPALFEGKGWKKALH